MMNYYFLTSAILIVISALIHSCLGEKMVMTPTFKLNLPPLLGSSEQMKMILRFAWHMVSIIALTVAVILFYLAQTPMTPELSIVAKILSVSFVVASIVSFIMTRGRHFTWWVFLLMSSLIGYRA